MLVFPQDYGGHSTADTTITSILDFSAQDRPIHVIGALDKGICILSVSWQSQQETQIVSKLKKIWSIPIFSPKTRDKGDIWATWFSWHQAISCTNAALFKSNWTTHWILVKLYRTPSLYRRLKLQRFRIFSERDSGGGTQEHFTKFSVTLRLKGQILHVYEDSQLEVRFM